MCLGWMGDANLSAQTLSVSAGASLREALQAIAQKYTTETGIQIEYNFGGSGVLLAQIRQGAPVDIFISAAAAHMDEAQNEKLIVPATRCTIARNQLVLIAPADSAIALAGFPQLPQSSIHRLAVGQPKTVPAGMYAMQVFESLKLTESLRDRIVHGGNVRQVLDYVARGEVEAGIVYRSDARIEPDRVRMVAIADAAWHEPIIYPAAVLVRSMYQTESLRFLKYLAESESQKVFTDYGFEPAQVLELATSKPAATPQASTIPTVHAGTLHNHQAATQP